MGCVFCTRFFVGSWGERRRVRKWWVMDGKCQDDGFRVSGGVDGRTYRWRSQGCMLQQLQNGSCRCQKLDASVMLGFGLYLDGIFGTKYSSSLANQTFAVPSAESSGERDRERKKGILVTSCGCAQNGHARCLRRKNYIELQGIISAFQCRHLLASKKDSYQLTLVHRLVFSPQIRANVITPSSCMAQAFNDR